MEKINLIDFYKQSVEDEKISEILGISEERAKYIDQAVNAAMRSLTSVGAAMKFLSLEEVGLADVTAQELFFISYLIGHAVATTKTASNIFKKGKDFQSAILATEILNAQKFYNSKELHIPEELQEGIDIITGKAFRNNGDGMSNPFKKKGFDIPNA